MLAYASVFFVLGICFLFITKQIDISRFKRAFLPFILGGAIAIPLVSVTSDLVKGINRLPWSS
jgi:biotin transporter BioY